MRDANCVSEGDADLRRRAALLGELDDLVNEIVGADLDPGWGRLSVREASACDTFAA